MSYWDHDTIFAFLELYKNHPCVWNPQHEHYKQKQKHNEAWIDIAENMEMDYTVEELKKKKESLMTSYRKCKIKEQSGDVDDVCWFAFSYMDDFLGPIYAKKNTMKNAKNEDHEATNTTDHEAEDTRSSIEFDTEEPAVLKLKDTQHDYYIQSTSKPKKRRHNDPLQLSDIRSTVNRDQEYTEEQILEEIVNIPDDECATFGTLVAQKLRKLSDDRRDVMMVKINQLFVDERQHNVVSQRDLLN